MDSADVEVLSHVVASRQAGFEAALVTVMKTWGSSPRPQGSMLAIRSDGVVVGSVSGGCIEDDLIARYQSDLRECSTPELLTYGVSTAQAHQFNLPCGGTVQVLFEPSSRLDYVAELLVALQARQVMVREIDLATGSTAVRAARKSECFNFDGRRLRVIHGPRYRLLIIGAGQLSLFLARVAMALDYEVTICDPRAEYSAPWSEPGVRCLDCMPDDAVLEIAPDERTAIVTLSHDPKLDDMALLEALKSKAFYVGAIGSRENQAKRQLRLKYFDMTDQQISMLRGPIGIYLGSQNPMEIGISILAEITAFKNQVRLPDSFRIDFAKGKLDRQTA